VVLRGIDIDGAGLTLGTIGVNVLAARSVTLEDVSIRRFSTAGVQLNATTPVKLLLDGVQIARSTAGVLVPATATGASSVSLHDTTISGAADGVRVLAGGPAKVLLDGVAIVDPTARGVVVTPTAGAAPTVRIRNSTVTGANPAIESDLGGYAGLVGSFIADNTLGLMHDDTGQIEDLGGNTFSGNAADGQFTITPPPAPPVVQTVTVTTPAPPPVTNTVTVTRTVCAVPSMTGLTLSRARAALALGHCATGKVVQRATSVRSRIGRVIAQSVKAGTQTGEGTKVSLQIGRKA
jgi:hypothetical protein